MVVRKFTAADNEALKVASSSPYGTPGDAIINTSDTAVGTIFQFTGGYQDRVIWVEDTSADNDTFNDDDAQNHTIIDGKGIVADGSKVESESHIYVRMLDSNGNETGDKIQLTVFSKGGVTSDIWGFATDTPLVDGAKYVKVTGNHTGDSDYEDFTDVDGKPCFAAGTLIATPSGPRSVEALRAGDLVLTFDRGPQPVQWATSSMVDLDETSANHPIRIKAGALGAGLPTRDLIVSPQHRVLINKDGSEVFAPAKALTPLKGVKALKAKRKVEYVHILLAPHAVILSEGLATESFFPGPMALASLPQPTRKALQDHLSDSTAFQETCRPSLTYREAHDWAKEMADWKQANIGFGPKPADEAALSA